MNTKVLNFNKETYRQFKEFKKSNNYNAGLQKFIDDSADRMKFMSKTNDVNDDTPEFIYCRNYYNELIKTLPNYDYLQYMTEAEWVIYRKEKKERYKDYLSKIKFTSVFEGERNLYCYDGWDVDIKDLSSDKFFVDMPFEYFKLLPVKRAELLIQFPKNEFLLTSPIKELRKKEEKDLDIRVKIVFVGLFDFSDLETCGPYIDLKWSDLKLEFITEKEIVDGYYDVTTYKKIILKDNKCDL